MQALSAERIFRDVDDSGNGTVSPKELISFFRKHIGHGKVVADSVLAEVITDLFKESSVFQSKRFNDGDEADNDSLSLKEFLAVFCGGSSLGEAMYCMDLDARKKKGKTADGDLKGTLGLLGDPRPPGLGPRLGAPAHARRHPVQRGQGLKTPALREERPSPTLPLPPPWRAPELRGAMRDEISLGKIINEHRTRSSHARTRARRHAVVDRRRRVEGGASA